MFINILVLEGIRDQVSLDCLGLRVRLSNASLAFGRDFWRLQLPCYTYIGRQRPSGLCNCRQLNGIKIHVVKVIPKGIIVCLPRLGRFVLLWLLLERVLGGMLCLSLGDQCFGTVKEVVIIKITKLVLDRLFHRRGLLVRFFRGHDHGRVVSLPQNACLESQQGLVIEIVIPIIRRGFVR